MTPSQEKKLDEIYAITLRTEGKLMVVDEKLETHRTAILEHEKSHIETAEKISSLEGDRNKVIGAMWFSGTGLFAGIIAFFYNIFKH